MRRRMLLATAGTLLVAPAGLRAQGVWPERPVRIIVPFPPGQAADTVVRIVADELSRRWPQRVVVENRGGAAGVPGVETGARAVPDGYTLTNGTSGTFGINPGVLPRLPYDPRAVQRCWVGRTGSALPHRRDEVRRLTARGIPEAENV